MLGNGGIARQQHLRLDLDQRRRHEDKLAAQIDIQLVRAAQEVEILIRDLRDRDVVDVDLVPANQVKQEADRPFVVLEPDPENGVVLGIIFRWC